MNITINNINNFYLADSKELENCLSKSDLKNENVDDLLDSNNIYESSIIDFENYQERNWAYFFKHEEPSSYYPMGMKNGEINVFWPEDKKRDLLNMQKVIYFFKNRKNGRLLIGKTGSAIGKRLSSYLTILRRNENTTLPLEFVQDIKSSPEDFDFGFYPLTSDEDLDFFEIGFIEHKGQDHKLYNLRKGGAGGCARISEIPSTYFIMQLTPIKRYPVTVDEDGKIKTNYSPGLKKYIDEQKQEMIRTKQPYINFTYSYKKISKSNDESLLAERYIGTSNDPIRRDKEHIRAAQKIHDDHLKKQTHKNLQNQVSERKRRLAKALFKTEESFKKNKKNFQEVLAEDAAQFTFGLIPIKYLDPNKAPDDPENLALKEKAVLVVHTIGAGEVGVIAATNSYFGGCNKNKGGGGTIPRPINTKTI